MTGSEHVVQTKYRVLYGDVDAMNVMYYANYLRLFERGRAEYMRDRGLAYRALEEQGFVMPATEAHVHYYKSARYDDLLVIETRVTRVKRASIRFDYDIFRSEDGREKLADGWSVHACVTPAGKVARLPDSLLELLQD